MSIHVWSAGARAQILKSCKCRIFCLQTLFSRPLYKCVGIDEYYNFPLVYFWIILTFIFSLNFYISYDFIKSHNYLIRVPLFDILCLKFFILRYFNFLFGDFGYKSTVYLVAFYVVTFWRFFLQILYYRDRVDAFFSWYVIPFVGYYDFFAL